MRIIMIAILFFVAGDITAQSIFDRDGRYSNYNGSFTYREMRIKGRDLRMAKLLFEDFKNQHQTDTVLYRLCKKRFWKLWKYPQYLFSAKYQLPYLSWKEIEERRKKGRLSVFRISEWGIDGEPGLNALAFCYVKKSYFL